MKNIKSGKDENSIADLSITSNSESTFVSQSKQVTQKGNKRKQVQSPPTPNINEYKLTDLHAFKESDEQVKDTQTIERINENHSVVFAPVQDITPNVQTIGAQDINLEHNQNILQAVELNQNQNLIANQQFVPRIEEPHPQPPLISQHPDQQLETERLPVVKIKEISEDQYCVIQEELPEQERRHQVDNHEIVIQDPNNEGQFFVYREPSVQNISPSLSSNQNNLLSSTQAQAPDMNQGNNLPPIQYISPSLASEQNIPFTYIQPQIPDMNGGSNLTSIEYINPFISSNQNIPLSYIQTQIPYTNQGNSLPPNQYISPSLSSEQNIPFIYIQPQVPDMSQGNNLPTYQNNIQSVDQAAGQQIPYSNLYPSNPPTIFSRPPETIPNQIYPISLNVEEVQASETCTVSLKNEFEEQLKQFAQSANVSFYADQENNQYYFVNGPLTINQFFLKDSQDEESEEEEYYSKCFTKKLEVSEQEEEVNEEQIQNELKDQVQTVQKYINQQEQPVETHNPQMAGGELPTNTLNDQSLNHDNTESANLIVSNQQEEEPQIISNGNGEQPLANVISSGMNYEAPTSLNANSNELNTNTLLQDQNDLNSLNNGVPQDHTQNNGAQSLETLPNNNNLIVEEVQKVDANNSNQNLETENKAQIPSNENQIINLEQQKANDKQLNAQVEADKSIIPSANLLRQLGSQI